MRTRSGTWYEGPATKRRARRQYMDDLPDDIVISILAKLSSAASFPSHFFPALLTCKRFNALGQHDVVLQNASAAMMTVRASSWSDGAHGFLKRCADAGNVEACYTLGMIRFYCLKNREAGASLMARAAMASHAGALYSLGIIKLNGSGGGKDTKDLRAGVALCARAAFLGHVDAMREVGHCLQDGYGVPQNVAEGRRFLIHANARELVSLALTPSPSLSSRERGMCMVLLSAMQGGCPLLSDYGCNVPPAEAHPAAKFMVEWFNMHGGGDEDVRLCSYEGCGRAETRKHEFRRCSACGRVNYCSRSCQALHWKLRHKSSCSPSPYHSHA